MPWSDIYRRYARYNRAVNQQLLDACSGLNPKQLNQPCGLHSDSLLGIWNHLLVTDIGWLNHLSTIFPILEELRTLPAGALSSHPGDNLDSLRSMRTSLDDICIRWCDLLRADDARDVLIFTNPQGEEVARSLDLILQHIFNYQTHYRGQISAGLDRLGVDYGTTDLLFNPAVTD